MPEPTLKNGIISNKYQPMNKISTIFVSTALFAFCFTSCKTVQVAKFTSVENLYQLKLNSSLEEVVSLLGSKPYNILSNQVEGYTIFTYKYKFVERLVNPKLINTRGGEIAGTEVYSGKEQTVFLFFKANKLELFVTNDGRKDSPALIMLNNTLYTITKDKEKYIIVPSTSEEAKEGLRPFSKKINMKNFNN
jgi:L-rhamnose isomerase